MRNITVLLACLAGLTVFATACADAPAIVDTRRRQADTTVEEPMDDMSDEDMSDENMTDEDMPKENMSEENMSDDDMSLDEGRG